MVNSAAPLLPLHVVGIRWTDALADEARRIRFAVFVDEQRVPPDEEIDAIDDTAHHAVVLDAAGRAWATGRTFPDPRSTAIWRIGRMAVSLPARKLGAGTLLMQHLMTHALAQPGCRELVLSAQTHAVAFYGRFGFEPEGPEYFDAGIPHRTMRFVRRGAVA
jgi:predicted GNAT family N-acyltransferase